MCFTCCDEHWVLCGTNGSLITTSNTDDVLYSGYLNKRKKQLIFYNWLNIDISFHPSSLFLSLSFPPSLHKVKISTSDNIQACCRNKIYNFIFLIKYRSCLVLQNHTNTWSVTDFLVHQQKRWHFSSSEVELRVKFWLW